MTVRADKAATTQRVRRVLSITYLLGGLFLLTLPQWYYRDPTEAFQATLSTAVAGVLLTIGITSLVSEYLDPTRYTHEQVLRASVTGSDPDTIGGLVRNELDRALTQLHNPAFEFGPRSELLKKLDIASCNTELVAVLVSGSQRYELLRVLGDLFQTKPGFMARVLFAHPYSQSLAMRARDLEMPISYLRDSITESLTLLRHLRDSRGLADRLQVRGYDVLPYFGLMSCDRVRAVLIMYREGRRGDLNFGLFLQSGVPTDAFLRELHDEFNGRWSHSVDLLGHLQVLGVNTSRPVEGRILIEVRFDRPLQSEATRVEAGRRSPTIQTTDSSVTIDFELPSGQPEVVKIVEAVAKDRSAWLVDPYIVNIA